MVKRKTVPEFPLDILRPHILRGTWRPNRGKNENQDIEAVPSTCAEKVCFSLAVENEVEGTWKSLKDYKIISRYIVFCDIHMTVESHA